MGPYEHGGDGYAHPGALDFSASLNPLGMPPAARVALAGCADACERYPDPHCHELTSALADHEGVDASWVLACAGATDVLHRVCLALRPRRALVLAPSYAGYRQPLEQLGCEVVEHRLRPETGFACGPELVRDLGRGFRLVFLANPNNPTGRTLPRPVLLDVLTRARELGALVVLDECFVDLSEGERSNDLLSGHPELLIVKALTKTHALAGLRVGYALSSDAGILARLREAGQPWAVGVPAQLAGVASLTDADYLARSRALIARERRRLSGKLAELGLHVVPSEANYLLFRAWAGLAWELLARGVLVRPCGNFHGLDDRWYRVAVRDEAENAALVAALRAVCGDAPVIPVVPLSSQEDVR